MRTWDRAVVGRPPPGVGALWVAAQFPAFLGELWLLLRTHLDVEKPAQESSHTGFVASPTGPIRAV